MPPVFPVSLFAHLIRRGNWGPSRRTRLWNLCQTTHRNLSISGLPPPSGQHQPYPLTALGLVHTFVMSLSSLRVRVAPWPSGSLPSAGQSPSFLLSLLFPFIFLLLPLLHLVRRSASHTDCLTGPQVPCPPREANCTPSQPPTSSPRSRNSEGEDRTPGNLAGLGGRGQVLCILPGAWHVADVFN